MSFLKVTKEVLKSNWFGLLGFVVACLSLAMAISAINQRDKVIKQTSDYPKQIKRLKDKLDTEKAIVTSYRNYMKQTASIVQDKYSVGDTYGIVVSGNYYSVTEDQYNAAEIGQEFDISMIEKYKKE